MLRRSFRCGATGIGRLRAALHLGIRPGIHGLAASRLDILAGTWTTLPLVAHPLRHARLRACEVSAVLSEWIMLGVGLLLTIGTGLFVASEFALVNLDRADLEARRERGESRLTRTISALKITSTHLSSAQLVITLTTLLSNYTMEPAISSLLAPVYTSWGLPAG